MKSLATKQLDFCTDTIKLPSGKVFVMLKAIIQHHDI